MSSATLPPWSSFNLTLPGSEMSPSTEVLPSLSVTAPARWKLLALLSAACDALRISCGDLLATPLSAPPPPPPQPARATTARRQVAARFIQRQRKPRELDLLAVDQHLEEDLGRRREQARNRSDRKAHSAHR